MSSDFLHSMAEAKMNFGWGKSMSFREGDLIGVPCAIQLGPFPDELLVTADTAEGPICGFVRKANIQTADGEHGVVKGSVVEVRHDAIVVKLFGSFFTTALGVASVRPNGLMRLAAQ
jgi:hypothetical protein